MERKHGNKQDILHDNSFLFFTLVKYHLIPLFNNSKIKYQKDTWQGEKYSIKKSKECSQKCSNKECFHFFSFFIIADRPFYVFLFLAVSCKIRFWGGGEWVCEKAAEDDEEVKDRGWRNGLVWCCEGFRARCHDVFSWPFHRGEPSALESSFSPQQLRLDL